MTFEEAQAMQISLGTIIEALEMHREDFLKRNKISEDDLRVHSGHALKHMKTAHTFMGYCAKELAYGSR